MGKDVIAHRLNVATTSVMREIDYDHRFFHGRQGRQYSYIEVTVLQEGQVPY